MTLTVFILKGKGNIRCLFGYRMVFGGVVHFLLCLYILLKQYCQVSKFSLKHKDLISLSDLQASISVVALPRIILSLVHAKSEYY